MSTTINNVVNDYTYTYQKKLQPKLDKNDDAVWDKSELQKYADEYGKATGTKIDVDKIMEKYSNADGVIDYKSQQQMKTDDALGLNKLQELVNAANKPTTTPSTTGPTTTTGTAMTQDRKFAIYDAVNAFSFEYKGKLQPLLDKNNDGMWNKDELKSYATAYNKVTGGKLDVDKLIEKYGNADGNIDPTNQENMKKDDALGLTALKTAYDAARSTPTVSLTNKEPNASKPQTAGSNSFSLQDLLGSMSSSGKASFSTNINRLDSQSALLNSFNSSTASSSMQSLLSSANSLNMYKSASTSGNSQAIYAAMSGSLMNFAL